MITTNIKERGRLWEITVETEPLTAEDEKFIRNFDPVIYWSDTSFYHWAFDEKLPSGRWLENMRFEDGLTRVTAYVH